MDKLPLTPKEATELLGISRSKLYELLRARTIESVKVGDCRRVPKRPWMSTSSVYGAKPLHGRCRPGSPLQLH
jgi:excisionase family DNA binding protein